MLKAVGPITLTLFATLIGRDIVRDCSNCDEKRNYKLAAGVQSTIPEIRGKRVAANVASGFLLSACVFPLLQFRNLFMASNPTLGAGSIASMMMSSPVSEFSNWIHTSSGLNAVSTMMMTMIKSVDSTTTMTPLALPAVFWKVSFWLLAVKPLVSGAVDLVRTEAREKDVNYEFMRRTKYSLMFLLASFL